ncbi:MAG: hypothetical protein GY821_10395 [Gammaproteobacteria bacterium]|nr:hypothetical protein [Gammaproteobacteria bacterium]
MTQIAEMIKLPKSLAHVWYNRGYYGTVNHNVKAVYQYYLGWFDGNPAHLHPLPTVTTARKYVEYMGGSKAILKRAKKDYSRGHYRWVAQVVNQLVFAQPNNKKAKALLANSYEQLGYQAESGPWRNFYLSAALELRKGVNNKAAAFKTASADFIKAMPLNLFYQFLAIHLNGEKAAGNHIIINWHFPDTEQQYVTDIDNAVLHYNKGQSKQANATIRINRDTLDNIIAGQTSFKQAVEEKTIEVKGNQQEVKTFFSLMDKFKFWFNIVTPQPHAP